MFKIDKTFLINNFITILFRSFGWIILGLIFSFFVNNILVLSLNYPKFYSVFSQYNLDSFIILGIYILGVILPISFVICSPSNTLRFDAEMLHKFNVYFIRSCFWAVIFVGLTDFFISFMRVERILPILLNDYFVRALGRSAFVDIDA